MYLEPTRIFPLGDNAVTVEFGTAISEPLNEAAIALAEYFNANPFSGMIEAVPAFASTTIFFRPHQLSSTAFDCAFNTVSSLVRSARIKISISRTAEHKTVTVPVSFDARDALDLEEVTEYSGLNRQQVIDLFIGSEYRVYMLGFLPGFAYMGIVDERIAIPRRSEPRLSVPKGSVGIAGRQTGIYPSASPGGWQIIGRTSMELIKPGAELPCVLSPGNSVRFVQKDG